ncbi:hypothetical protein O6H91_22G002400 [Diphasiastrum complanatum]|uniref:Uncharacterized protein n=6 Tax=Diphasiastrum complanatum TaxID=34168 RepID=A0ACC2AC70_DIPCM|nr:hypothetical protein O6H91_Y304600 [Diphasiastrum complanatum]KAJ7289921.1 hypothetical protein O6H91_Y304600 [Diphasiastrum complanatum]KAJ7289922.1 hypothetical protein O6H91_Y304600 [Diphasiastrum complanatum]KAJ7289923.1 hypothetical protein O6H91_Y304600 [Diphasiastrum complanatum]KAJ7515158.1 hypothetical protein O6H91_22G002400 [Diphasiastrum complanatum]
MASKHTELSDVHGADIRTSSFRDDEENAFAHKVQVPAHIPLVREFEDAVKEVFFPDDPLRKFRNQTPTKKYLLGLFYVFPIFEWMSTYKLQYLKDDLIAGLTIASLAVPQDLGYAKLANLQPIDGLYGSFVPPLIYAVLGSSRHIAIGPVAVVSILLGTLLRHEVNPTNTALYFKLALTSTFFAGVFQAGLGLLRLGFIIDFLSHAAIVGFMAGAAITIGLQQLKGLLGIKNFTTKTDFISVMRSVWRNTHQWSRYSILIGLFFLAFLLITKYIGKRKKKLFWVAALAPLTSVILATAFVRVTHLEKHGVQIVGHIHKGVNPSSIHQLEFSGSLVSKAVRIGLITGLVALTEAIAIGRTFAALEDYQLDGNKEMIALGIMNIIGSCTSCFITTGSFSRSAVNYNAGVKTAISNIVMSIAVLVTLVALTPLFKYTPNCILAVIIISAVISLIDVRAAYLIWKVDKLDFLACMGAFLGVFFISVEIGLLIAVGISLAKVLLHVTRPHTAILGNIPGTNIYRNIQQYPDASRVPGILVIRIDSSIYFSNSNYIRERVVRWVNDEDDRIGNSKGVALQFVILELSPVMSIDTTGIMALEELCRTLQKRKIQLALANPGAQVMEKFHAAKFIELLGDEWFFLTVGEAVHVCSRQLNSSFEN